MSFQQSEFCVVNRFLVCMSETRYLHAENEKKFKIWYGYQKSWWICHFSPKFLAEVRDWAQVWLNILLR